jgi:serine/threonine protein kinase
MAPEQFLGEPADARTDQFAFCVALYEALFKRAPFAGRSFDELRANVIGGRLRSPPQAQVSHRRRQAVCRGLSGRREARFRTMRSLIAALDIDS